MPFHLFPGVRYSAPPWNTMEHDRPRFKDPLKFLRPKRAQSALLSTTDGAGPLLDIFILDHFWTHTDPKTTGCWGLNWPKMSPSGPHGVLGCVGAHWTCGNHQTWGVVLQKKALGFAIRGI